MTLRTHIAMLLFSVGMTLWHAGAPAQDTPPADGKAALEEIVVTAQKRSERLIDTPQSVSALTGADLAKLGATQLSDFVSTVPGLQFSTQGAGRSTISLRGVTTGNDVGQTVGIYVDEVPYGSSASFVKAAQLGLDVGLFDLERIEVLRGPQGTLYGASSMGGVFKYVMHTPSLTEFGGSVQAGLADTRHGGTSYNGAAVINAPLAKDKAALRASAFYSRDGGYIDNLGRGQKDVDAGKLYGGRVDLLLQPTDELSVRINGFAQNNRRDGVRYSEFDFTGVPVNGSLDQDHSLEEPFSSDFRLASATIGYDFGTATLTSVTSYQSATATYTPDVTQILVPLLAQLGIVGVEAAGNTETSETKKFAQEVRIASPSSQSLEWLVGGFYTDEKSTLVSRTISYGGNFVPLPIEAYAFRSPSSYEEYAVFGNLTYHLTDKFDVSGGVRFSWNNQKFEQIALGLLVVGVPEAKSDESVVTYLANARYRFSDRVMAYARFATGYRPGGPNPGVVDPLTGQPLFRPTFESDTLESYEVGVKAETPDRKFGIDASAYYIDWNDIQVVAFAGAFAGFVNAPGAGITGGELTLTAKPVNELSVVGTVAYNDSSLNAAVPELGAAKNERLPNVPHVTATVSVDYTDRDSAFGPSVGASLRYISDRPVSFDNNFGNPQYDLPDYATIDLRAGATFGAAAVQFYVRNLFDKRGQQSGLTYLAPFGGPAQITIVQPRTIGLNLTTHF